MRGAEMASQIKAHAAPNITAAAAVPEPHLYLVTPPLSAPAGCLPISAEAAAACGVACLFIRTAAISNAAKLEQIFQGIAVPFQERGIACLVADDSQFCLRVGADGVHLDWGGPCCEDALRALTPNYIVGAGGLRTRHDAMIAAEAGADYVMFGEEGWPQSAIAGLVAWWAQNITVPCVGYASGFESIRPLVGAGADFIALGSAVFSDPRGAESALREAAALVKPALQAGC